MQNFKTNEKGITLIALIITIIVMLILVGVTINVALNGGLFDKAETASKQTQLAADKEVLYLEAIEVYNEKEGTLDTTKLKANLEAMKWTVNSDGNPFICTSPKRNQLKITLENRNIKVEDYNNEDNKDNTGSVPTIAYGKKYIMAEEKEIYIIFSENGILSGGIIPNNTTYEMKVEEGKNTIYVTEEGKEATLLGTFNDQFTEFTHSAGIVFKLDDQNEPDLVNTRYVGIVEQEGVETEINITFNENGSLTYSVPQKNHSVDYNYEFKETGDITVNGESQSYNNVIITNYITENGIEKELYGYFNEDFTTINIIHTYTWDEMKSVLSEIYWSECTLTQE